MDLKTTKETILRWICSCETLEQMQLCSDAIDFFIIDRFANKIDPIELSEAIYELHTTMGEREVKIVSKNVVFMSDIDLQPNLN